MKRIFTLIITVCVALNLLAQNNNLQRYALFTLGENEEIYYNEYFAAQNLNQNRFACVIKNTLTNTYTFVFNGRRIITTDYVLDIKSLNLNEHNGYVLSYWDGEELYLNSKGTVYDYLQGLRFDGNNNERFWYSTLEEEQIKYYVQDKGNKAGPFDEVRFDENYDYLYLLSDKWYGHKNGTNELIPPEKDEDAKIYTYRENGKAYVSVYGRPSQGYDKVYDLHVRESGKYTYKYTNSGKYYVNINGKASQASDDEIHSLHLTESGQYIYCYKNNGKWHVSVNGSSSRGYDNVKDLQITSNGKYAYSYEDNGKEYVNINGSESQGYDKIGYHWDYYYYGGVHITENNQYAYSYKDNDKWHVNINGNVAGGYNRIYGFRMDDKGNYYYQYDTDEGRLYQNDNGKESKTDLLISNMSGESDYYGIRPFRTSNSNLVLYSADKRHAFYSGYKYEYVIIDGKSYGKSPALHAWYDKDKNAFIWNTVEGKELVMYEFRL